MLNLLQPAEKKAVQREYYMRLVVVTLIFVSLTIIVAGLLLIPSYILTLSKESIAQEKQKSLDQMAAQQNNAALLEEMRLINTELSLLASDDTVRLPSDTIARVVELKGGDIALQSFTYTKGDAGVELVVGGIAATRNALVSFVRTLRQETPYFTSAELPVSNLAQDQDIDFSILIKVQ